MRIKSLLLLLILAIGNFLFFSCESNFPAGQLIVKGKVMDETGIPISGIGLNLDGTNQKGITQLIPTFNLYMITDKNGMYNMSTTVPSKTNWVEIRIIDYQYLIQGVLLDTGIVNRYIPYSVNGEKIIDGKYRIPSSHHKQPVDLNFVLKNK